MRPQQSSMARNFYTHQDNSRGLDHDIIDYCEFTMNLSFIFIFSNHVFLNRVMGGENTLNVTSVHHMDK